MTRRTSWIEPLPPRTGTEHDNWLPRHPVVHEISAADVESWWCGPPRRSRRKPLWRNLAFWVCGACAAYVLAVWVGLWVLVAGVMR